MHQLGEHSLKVVEGTGTVGANMFYKGVDDRTTPTGVLDSHKNFLNKFYPISEVTDLGFEVERKTKQDYEYNLNN